MYVGDAHRYNNEDNSTELHMWIGRIIEKVIMYPFCFK
jgi:hypothetical protein